MSNQDYDVLEYAWDLCDAVDSAAGRGDAVIVATAAVRAAHKAAALLAPVAVKLKTSGWPVRLKETADPLDAAIAELKAARDANDRAAIQAALGRLQQLAIPADENEITTKLLGLANGRLGDGQKPIKAKARTMGAFEAAVKAGDLDLRFRR